ncbi:siderophore-interacting protein [Amycolatopsis sp. NPDC051128]|uniref:siderophore-interacting protein n=1 Tax=Amycolatopsis sp. NPDC051128 TaxID=3155412 RepID=UPI00341AD9DC
MTTRPVRHRVPASVVDVVRLSETFVRITLVLGGAHGVRFDDPAGWVKLFVTDPDTGAQVGRAYTVRQQRFAEIDLDIVLHGNGPVARWAEAPLLGEVVTVAGPRGGFTHPEPGPAYLLAGDESAAPAIASILGSLPEGHGRVTAILEGGEHELPPVDPARTSVCSLRRRAGTKKGALLAPALRALPKPSANSVIWVAGEAGAVHEARRLFLGEWGLERGEFTAKGYWKYGEADHRE